MTVVSDGLFMQGKTNEVLSSFFSFFGFWFYVKILDLYWALLVLKSLYNLNKFSFKEKKINKHYGAEKIGSGTHAINEWNSENVCLYIP